MWFPNGVLFPCSDVWKAWVSWPDYLFIYLFIYFWIFSDGGRKGGGRRYSCISLLTFLPTSAQTREGAAVTRQWYIADCSLDAWNEYVFSKVAIKDWLTVTFMFVFKVGTCVSMFNEGFTTVFSFCAWSSGEVCHVFWWIWINWIKWEEDFWDKLKCLGCPLSWGHCALAQTG